MQADVAPRSRGMTSRVPASGVRADRILPEVQWVSALVALVLLTAWAILYLAWDTLAEAICHVIALTAPRRIVIGGGVAGMGEEVCFVFAFDALHQY